MNDDELKKWQQRQIEKSQIENVINSIVETCSNLQGEFPPSNILRFYEHQNSSNFEESAILMAIHAHGLQQNPSTSSSSSIAAVDTSNTMILENSNYSRPCHHHHNFPQLNSSSSSSSSIIAHNQNNFNNDLLLSSSSAPSSSSFPFDSNNIHNDNENNVNFEISNLMETAVSVAIQKQGLGLEPNR